MGDNIEKITQRIMDISNPDINYTQEDFDKEFSPKNLSFTNDNFKITFNFKNISSNEDPEYATNGSSGFDLRANLTEPMHLSSGEFKLVPTGLFFEIPENFEIQIRPRSGLAAKNGVSVLNTPGTIDSDYRGEIKVILINQGKDTFTINHGDRIAQAVIATVTAKNIIKLTRVEDISTNTERGIGGFGSTGKN